MQQAVNVGPGAHRNSDLFIISIPKAFHLPTTLDSSEKVKISVKTQQKTPNT